MENKTLRSDILLLLTSAIWGFAFVAQVKGMDYIGPNLYNAVRFALGAISLVPLIYYMRNRRRKAGRKMSVLSRKRVILTGMIAGTILFTGAALQQIGLQYTTAGKAGFITGLYVVLVPLLGILLKHKTGIPTWIGAVLAVIGLYLISFTGGGVMGKGDFMVFLSSFGFACHVLFIDNFSKKVEPVLLSALQFIMCSLISFIAALLTEPIALESIIKASVPILYGGLGSVGIAYTLQVIAQRDAPPAHSAIIMSFESVFAVVGGIIFLSEGMTLRGIIGCCFMMAGMVLSQWELIFKRK